MSHRIGKYAFLIVTLSLGAILFTGCSASDKKVDGTMAKNTSETEVITFSWNKDIGNLNPHMYLPSQFFAQAMVFESLVNYGKDGKIEPSLASDWKASDDGKTYTFHLRQKVTFSDGSTFNSKTVKRNFDTVLANSEAHSWLGLINEIESTEALDDYTFLIHLKHPYYPILQELTLVRPLRFLAEAGFPDSGNTANGINKAIGTGPWILSDYKKDEQAVFIRNENYWGKKPRAKKVIVKIIPDGESRVLSFEKGELDFIYGTGLISLDSFNKLKKSGKYNAMNSEPQATRLLVLNSNRGPTKDLLVRQALEHGFNKQAVIDHLFYGTETLADQLISSNFPYTDTSIKTYGYEPEKSKQLLDMAGWKLPQGKEYREKDGKTLELELKYISSDSIQKSLSEVVQSEFKNIGIKVRLNAQEEQSFWDQTFKGQFDLVFDETWGAPYDPHAYVSAMRSSEHSSSSYQAQLGLPMKAELDQKISQALLSTDENERKKLYKDIFTTLQEQAVYLPISYEKTIAVLHNNVKGFDFMPTQYEVPLTETVVGK
jgi:nickel transport system substrate-binding protein